MAAHAKLSPSGASRWMECPGSIALEADFPDSSSEYAAEGTLAHDISAQCLEENLLPHSFVGKRFEVDGFEFTVTAAMADFIADYMKLVREFAKDGTLLIERKVDFSPVIGVEDSFGTSDAIVIGANTLTVIDLKYGMGVAVSAENNPQLKLYALGALNDYGDLADFEHVCMVIHQPRLNSVSECWMSVEDLVAFGEAAKMAAEKVAEAVDTYGAHDAWDEAYLSPSEKGCKFCKAKATCPALRTEVDTVVGNAASVDDMKSFLQDLPVDDLGNAMDKVALVEQWCKGVIGEVGSKLRVQPSQQWHWDRINIFRFVCLGQIVQQKIYKAVESNDS